MCKSLVTFTMALAIVSLGSLISDRAQAGSSTSASSRYNYAIIAANQHPVFAANQHPVQSQPRAQAARSDITSFSSSSAKGTLPTR
jgi:hypothetical protein